MPFNLGNELDPDPTQNVYLLVEDKTAWSVAKKIQTRDKIEGHVMEAEANEMEKDFNLGEILFVL